MRARLLFDQNLAPRLARDLADLFPDSAHVTGTSTRPATKKSGLERRPISS
jgi:predicted nuclease of predicted toxin-antitoxin system